MAAVGPPNQIKILKFLKFLSTKAVLPNENADGSTPLHGIMNWCALPPLLCARRARFWTHELLRILNDDCALRKPWPAQAGGAWVRFSLLLGTRKVSLHFSVEGSLQMFIQFSLQLCIDLY